MSNDDLIEKELRKNVFDMTILENMKTEVSKYIPVTIDDKIIKVYYLDHAFERVKQRYPEITDYSQYFSKILTFGLKRIFKDCPDILDKTEEIPYFIVSKSTLVGYGITFTKLNDGSFAFIIVTVAPKRDSINKYYPKFGSKFLISESTLYTTDIGEILMESFKESFSETIRPFLDNFPQGGAGLVKWLGFDFSVCDNELYEIVFQMIGNGILTSE